MVGCLPSSVRNWTLPRCRIADTGYVEFKPAPGLQHLTVTTNQLKHESRLAKDFTPTTIPEMHEMHTAYLRLTKSIQRHRHRRRRRRVAAFCTALLGRVSSLQFVPAANAVARRTSSIVLFSSPRHPGLQD